MKNKYNIQSACNNVTISSRSFCDLKKDEVLCINKKLDSLDFALWWDERLLENEDVSIHLPVFKYIISCIDKGYIFNSNFRNKNFRFACLIFSKFVNCDSSFLHNVRDNFLSDNPDFMSFKKEEPKIDFNSVFSYNHYQSNKSIFLYFKKNGVDDSLIAELISRQFLGFEEKGHNIVYVCRDLFDPRSLESHGMGSKHFMRLQGCFPFVYWSEDLDSEDSVKYERFDRFEIFEDTLSMLQYISSNLVSHNVLYCSVHTPNYNVECIKNLKKTFGDLPIKFHFENKKEIPEIYDNKEVETIINDVVNDIEKDVENDKKQAIIKDLVKNHFQYDNDKIISILSVIYGGDFSYSYTEEFEEKTHRVFTRISDKLEVYEDSSEKDLPF